ncbi:MAG: hypothetical protein WCI47_02865 [bacterium]
MSANAQGSTMGRGNHDGGYHHQEKNGDFVTANNTEDPQYPSGSYYVSYGNPSDGHVTVIHDSGGNVVDVKDSK